MKIKTGDNVKILSGKDQGKTGKVIQVIRDKSRNRTLVVVEKLNLLKKHLRTRKRGEKGQVVELPAPLDISNVQLIDPSSKKATRVGFKIEGSDKKRVAKKSGEFLN